MNSRTRWTLLVVAMMLAVSMLAPPVAAEDPNNQDCEIVGVLIVLCAGADAGTWGECTNTTPSDLFCEYTYGWNLLAESPVFLPGGGILSWSYEVEVCFDGIDCHIHEEGSDTLGCEWLLPLDECAETHTDGGSIEIALNLGQCVVVMATATAHTVAWTPNQEDAVFQREAAMSSTNGGAGCYLDDGRD